MRYFCLIFSLVHVLVFQTHAQDIEKIAKSKPVKINGGLGFDNVLYHSDGVDPRRNSPYQYFLNGNINFLFFGELSIPLTFAYSNQRFNYSNPLNQQQFNQFGISPKYKWATAHIGWRNMTFSPYSLNGHTFMGGGVNLTPGKWQIAAMYGRLLKPVELDTSQSGSLIKPAYQRMGMGINVKYEEDGNAYGVSMFRSIDDPNSLQMPLDSMGVTPEENLVWDFLLKQKISKNLTIEGEFANTAITQDSRNNDEGNAPALGIIKKNASTVQYQAYKAGFSYKIKKSKVGAGYERIAPGYRTHGAYFFNNDLENITVNFTTTFFKNKVNLSSNIGKQRNNLDDSKISKMRRWVGAVNLGWQATEKLNFSAGYSNFQTYTNMRNPFNVLNSNNPYQYIDTLNYVQVSQSITFSANYTISNTKKTQQNLSLNSSVQDAKEEQGGKKLPSGTTFYNANITYMYGIVPLNLAFNVSANGNWNQMIGADTKILGPTVGVSKSFFNKQMNTNLSYSWNTTLVNNERNGHVGSLRLTNVVSIKKKHNILLSAVWLNRGTNSTVTAVQNSFNEFTGRIGYNFKF